MIRSFSHRVQDRVFAAFGRSAGERPEIVRAMLQPRAGETTGYWLQLIIATMLATLGLTLDSAAVVIGAMLIAPLMKPLVELAMGLATGSAALAARTVVRTVASVVIVVATATAITWLLPFHEATREVAARTAPNLLDLAVAGACALAAAYATLRADAEIATTAAGTSIGISLVPPLCTLGYGIAIGDRGIARGAALLFTANLSGILAVATLVFVLAGFGRVDITSEEQTLGEDYHPGRAMQLGRALSAVAARRLGPISRIVPPLFMLALVYVPLQRALHEITQRSEIRNAIARLLGPGHERIVQYTLEHTANELVLRVVVVGDGHTASELDREVRAKLAELGVADPHVSVWAVPDAASVSALAHRVDELPPPVVPEPRPQAVHRYSSELAHAVRAAWPRSGTGELIDIALDLEHPDRVRIVHLGAPLGAPALQLLARALEPGAGHLEISEEALGVVEAEPAEAARWLPGAISLIERARRVGGLHLCVTIATPPAPHRGPPPVDPIATALHVLVDGAADATVSDGPRWRVEPVRGDCPARPPPAAPP